MLRRRICVCMYALRAYLGRTCVCVCVRTYVRARTWAHFVHARVPLQRVCVYVYRPISHALMGQPNPMRFQLSCAAYLTNYLIQKPSLHAHVGSTMRAACMCCAFKIIRCPSLCPCHFANHFHPVHLSMLPARPSAAFPLLLERSSAHPCVLPARPCALPACPCAACLPLLPSCPCAAWPCWACLPLCCLRQSQRM